MVEIKNLTKRYGAKTAVDDISFSVADGEILGFLGPNGAGKTTTMNIITGYTSSTSGTVTVDGAEILQNPIKVKKHVGYLPEHPPLYLDMTVDGYLSFMYDLKKVPLDKLPKQAHIGEICDLVKIGDVRGRVIRNLSKGYQQRVGLAQALLGNPDLLILDEPTVGLDPKQIIEIRNLIKNLGEKHTIILSSHILPEIQAVCSRVIVINKGKIVADGATENLSRSLGAGSATLTARIDGPQNDVYGLLAGMPELKRVNQLGSREEGSCDYELHPRPGEDVRRKLFGLLSERGWPLLGLRGFELSLEDIFLRLTADADRAAEDTHEDAGAPEAGGAGESAEANGAGEEAEAQNDPQNDPENEAENDTEQKGEDL